MNWRRVRIAEPRSGWGPLPGKQCNTSRTRTDRAENMASGEKDSSRRRTFFREALARVVAPVVESLRQRFEVSPDDHYLRPPGAIDEAGFLDTCYRCGSCVNACPAQAIFLLARRAGDAAGTPTIDPDRAACVVCHDLACTHACVSGALAPLSDPRRIQMGCAEVYGPQCVRSRGASCTLCVERCPMGAAAIRVVGDDKPPEILSSGCIGCGVCQHCCPTIPKAIVVKPCEGYDHERGPGEVGSRKTP